MQSEQVRILAQNAPKTVWRVGGARRTRWGSLQFSSNPLAGFRERIGPRGLWWGEEIEEEGKGRGKKDELCLLQLHNIRKTATGD